MITFYKIKKIKYSNILNIETNNKNNILKNI